MLAGGLTLLAWTTGCQSVGYYSQAIHGQFQLLHRSKPIEKVLKDPETPETLRTKLQLVLQLRAFAAEELQLPLDGQYLKYADLQRRFVVWNVYAAPEFSLDAKTWWYPIVGSLEYQGYFSEAGARRYADRLRKKGLDVFVGGVQAYSTLGWFKDPVLNTFVFDADAELADLIFHELAHQRLFVSGDTDFNEAFATAVAEEGVRQWLRSEDRLAELESYEAGLRRRRQFVELVTSARDRLDQVYRSAGLSSRPRHPDPETQRTMDRLRAGKHAVLDQLRSDYEKLKQTWNGDGSYDNWFRQPLNNAHLNDVDTYYTLVPVFRRIIEQNRGDWEQFFQRIDEIAGLPKERRHLKLRQLAGE